MTTESSTVSASPATGLTAFKPRVLHVAYNVRDIERALAFYVGVLGLKEQMRIPLGDSRHEVVLQWPDSKGAGVILMWNTHQSEPYRIGDGYSRLVVMVSDLDAALAHVTQHGAPVVTPATTAGTLKYAMIKDPDGYVIELLEIKRA